MTGHKTLYTDGIADPDSRLTSSKSRKALKNVKVTFAGSINGYELFIRVIEHGHTHQTYCYLYGLAPRHRSCRLMNSAIPGEHLKQTRAKDPSSRRSKDASCDIRAIVIVTAQRPKSKRTRAKMTMGNKLKRSLQ
ncbi:uncharacterized protein MELLADRAFT_108302 [Melampsora larici-populina 98AG31]|uniref:Uncharacterized protein n=1 Tax=Melampsora larici-populina (strain 98AG31 / pathotype 3-4-7) TaxID=747676 RepID=F4RSM9_MELLP|nr:uncharacterized protein MELLADRAFT_108302 [Melampsora larici-populina 98AG31]EGG04627.1 hypothetical protein MELLADRAFT_108302 [Melampsora larici-populina 98AG31]